MDFPKDEIGRLALQFINAKGEDVVISKDEQTLTRQMIALVQEELLKHGIKRTKKNSNFYDRLMIHLTYFIERLDQDDSDSKVSMKSLEEHIKRIIQKPIRLVKIFMKSFISIWVGDFIQMRKCIW